MRRSLEALTVGRVIDHVDVRLLRILRQPGLDEFVSRLQGARIEAISRRGKYLLFDLGDDVLIAHLRMEGRFGLYAIDDPILLHTHVIFHFRDNMDLRYHDVRQFGTMDLLVKSDIEKFAPLSSLGLEPLDANFTASYLEEKFRARRAPIKAVLLDQGVVAGLGNIYVDEILFAAQIHPERMANKLSLKDLTRIVDACVEIIQHAIRLGGSSIKSYVNGYGQPGSFQHTLRVYGRQGQPCVRCGDAIRKGRVAGRGTHVCLSCQKPPRTAKIRWVAST